MEHAELGSALDVVRREGPLSAPEVGWVCRAVLLALHYMHYKLRVIHRDIKAANVLITADGGVRLCDLGVAAQLFSTMSKRGTSVGTPHWMAPEALAHTPGNEGLSGYDAKVDVWGLAITAIELFEGDPPLSELRQIFQVIMRIVSGPPPKLREEDESASSAPLRAFLAAALIKDPVLRPTAAELSEVAFIAAATPDELLVRTYRQLLELRSDREARSPRFDPAQTSLCPGDTITLPVSPQYDSGPNTFELEPPKRWLPSLANGC